MVEEKYCHALAFLDTNNNKIFEDSYCIFKRIQKIEDDSCLAVTSESFIAGTGNMKYSPKKAEICPCNFENVKISKVVLHSLKEIFNYK